MFIKPLRKLDPKIYQKKYFIMKRCAVVALDVNIAIEAAKIHAVNKVETHDFGLADAIILASARSREMKVFTGDSHFENFEDAVML